MTKRKCIFSTPFIREEIDPRVNVAWTGAFGGKTPFGKLRLMWKEQHCAQVDPYIGDCPYQETDCAMAFLIAVERTASFAPERPTGYFRAVARSMGADRADNKPLARDIVRRTDVRKEGDPGGTSSSSPSRHDDDVGDEVGETEGRLHRSDRGPVRVGELLGSLNLRPRQNDSTDSQEGNK